MHHALRHAWPFKINFPLTPYYFALFSTPPALGRIGYCQLAVVENCRSEHCIDSVVINVVLNPKHDLSLLVQCLNFAEIRLHTLHASSG